MTGSARARFSRFTYLHAFTFLVFWGGCGLVAWLVAIKLEKTTLVPGYTHVAEPGTV